MQKYFEALHNYYDKIYVLSVRSAVERRELFAQRFLGLRYSFFYGADKNEFSIPDLEEKNIFSEDRARLQHRFGKTMRPGEIACSWSHRMMYEEMIAANYSRILVFEDDAVPDPAMMPLIPTILGEIPQDAELLFWGWDKNDKETADGRIKKIIYHLQHVLGHLKWDHRVIRNLYAKPFSRYIRKAGFHDYTYAYSVSRSGAEKLITMQTPLQYIADNLLAHAVTKEVLTGYIVWPKVFQHDSLPDGTQRDSYIR